MIILDTNVISFRHSCSNNPIRLSWLGWTTNPPNPSGSAASPLFEARYGIALLTSGQRKINLLERFDQLLQEDLENRVLLFDTNAADQAAQLAAQRKERGQPVDMRDTFIAGIALAKRCHTGHA